MSCPDENTLAAYVDGRAPPSELDNHLADCTSCRQQVFALVASPPRPDTQTTGRSLGGLGRFTLRDIIGKGGTGTVYRATDPTLDREVAIKVLSHDHKLSDNQRLRLLREARSLAKLTHPNVIKVFEAEMRDDVVFLVMEYLDNGSLDAWLNTERPWRDIVRVVTDAAKGLKAAHDLGYLHRDVKPHNILVDAQERGLIADFGLVLNDLEPGPDTEHKSKSNREPRDPRLTITGNIVGTPAFSAPEQLRGEPVTVAGDVYGLCATLLFALSGKLPYGDRDLYSMMRAQQAGETPTVELEHVPRRLRRFIAQGLSPDPKARPQSMAEVIGVLTPMFKPRWALKAAVVAACAVALGISASFLGNSEDPCGTANEHFAAVWTSDSQAALLEHVATIPEAGKLQRELSSLIADYQEQWTASHRSVCRATNVHKSQSEALLSWRMSCLGSRLDELEGAMSHTLQNSPFASLDTFLLLRSPRACVLSSPRTDYQFTAEEQRLNQTLSSGLFAARAESLAGHYKDAMEALQDLQPVAEKVGRGPAWTEYLSTAGEIQSGVDDKVAISYLQKALMSASRDGDSGAQASTLASLAVSHANEYEVDRALESARHALALLGSTNPDASLEATVNLDCATVFLELEATVEAKAALRRISELFTLMPDGAWRKRIQHRWALLTAEVELVAGDPSTALQLATSAISGITSEYGRDSALRAQALSTQAQTYLRLSRFDDARHTMKEVARIHALQPGSYVPVVALLAQAQSLKPGPEQLALLVRAKSLLELLPDAPPNYRIQVLHDLGDAYEQLGNIPAALPLYEEAVAFQREHAPDDAGQLGYALLVLLHGQISGDAFLEAAASGTEAISIFEKSLPSARFELTAAHLLTAEAYLHASEHVEGDDANVKVRGARNHLVRGIELMATQTNFEDELVAMASAMLIICDVQLGTDPRTKKREWLALRERIHVSEILEQADIDYLDRWARRLRL